MNIAELFSLTWGKALIKAIMKEGFEKGYCKECQLPWSAQREGHVKRK